VPGTGGHRKWSLHLRPVRLLQGVLPIRWKQVPLELLAGVTLACLAIPEVMGYTKIAGMPVITGLYTLVVPFSLYALLGSSRHMVVGADSASAAIMFAGLTGLAAAGSSQYVALASLLALMTGGLLILARVLRLGFIADFLSRTVLIGFLTGVGVQVACGQLASLLGIPEKGHEPVSQLSHFFGSLGSISWPTAIVSASVAAVLIAGPWLSKRVPWSLLAIVGSIVVSRVFNLASHGVSTLGTVPSGLPRFSWPHAPGAELGHLVSIAFALALIILTQSAATSRAYAARCSDKNFDENTDLLGLGAANLGAGLTGTFVVNGSPTKTEMVYDAGGRSQIASLAAAIVTAAVLLFLTRPLSYLPTAVLATVVFIIGVRLVDVRGMADIARRRIWEFAVAAIAALVVIFAGAGKGILVAMVLSLLVHVRHSYKPSSWLVTQTADGDWKGSKLSELAEVRPGLALFAFASGLYYANSNRFESDVRYLAEHAPGLRWLCVACEAVDDIDFTGSASLRELHGELEKKGVSLVLAAVAPKVRAELDRDGLTELIGREHIFRTLRETVDAFDRRTA
jgi:high affinity sulfate transporter 1